MEKLAAALADARLKIHALDTFPGALPQDLAGAYATQDAVIAHMKRAVRGWKVAMIPPALRAELGADRTAGPILEGSIQTLPHGGPVQVPVFADGAAALEAEFALVMDRDISGVDGMPDDDALRAAVASVHAGVEVASSPVRGIVEMGPLATTSDLGINAGALLGPEVLHWGGPGEDYKTSAKVNGAVTGEGSAAAIPGGVYAALAFLIAHLATRGRGLKRGDIVLTGMTNGAHRVTPGDLVEIAFAGTGHFEIEVTALHPKG